MKKLTRYAHKTTLGCLVACLTAAASMDCNSYPGRYGAITKKAVTLNDGDDCIGVPNDECGNSTSCIAIKSGSTKDDFAQIISGYNGERAIVYSCDDPALSGPDKGLTGCDFKNIPCNIAGTGWTPHKDNGSTWYECPQVTACQSLLGYNSGFEVGPMTIKRCETITPTGLCSPGNTKIIRQSLCFKDSQAQQEALKIYAKYASNKAQAGSEVYENCSEPHGSGKCKGGPITYIN